jgi:hypothetical protein
MGFWRRRIRALALGWGVLQFVLPLAILFADATSALAGMERRATAHVETADTNTCQPVHADECALCRFLTHSGATVPRPGLPTAVATSGKTPNDTPCASRAAAVQRLPDSRAPPIA